MSTKQNYQPVVIAETAGMPEEKWLELRKRGIGGSDVAAVLGLSPFCTARDIYFAKAGIKPAVTDEPNYVAKQVGHLLEPLVAEIFSMKAGKQISKVYKADKLFAHPEYPFMLANVDYFIEMPDGTTAVLECKTSNYNCQDKWVNGAVPLNYELQTRHYMAVTNVNTAFCACLFGNNENEFIYRRIDRDLAYEQDIIEQEKHFWEEYVQKQVEPPYKERGELILESIRRKYGRADISASVVTLDVSMIDIIEKCIELRKEKSVCDAQSRKLDKEIRQLYAPIVDIMGTNCEAVCESGSDEYVITYNPSYRESLNKDSLEMIKVFHPDIYDKYISEYVLSTESRTFKIKVKKEVSAA